MRPIAKINVQTVRSKDTIVLTVLGPLGGVIAGEKMDLKQAQELYQKLGAAIEQMKGQQIPIRTVVKL